MRLSKLLAAAKIPYDGADHEIERVVCDSRAAEKHTLFVCIRGFASDGHNFAQRAYAAGCRAFLCEYPVDLPTDALVIFSENTRIAQRSALPFSVFRRKNCRLLALPERKERRRAR